MVEETHKSQNGNKGERKGIICVFSGQRASPLIHKRKIQFPWGQYVQEFWLGAGETAKHICLPSANDEVLPGVAWGRGDMLDTPAYWALRCLADENPLHGFTSPDGSIIEEIGFCLLGGFGIKAELNDAAFQRLRERDVFKLEASVSEADILGMLTEPLSVAGRLHRYRFPNQRSFRIAAMREKLREIDLLSLPLAALKKLLLSLEGVGPKTAAWIIRNHFGSDEVAILDIHVVRACTRLGVFPKAVSLPKDYDPLEQRFIEFAMAMEVRPAVLDAVMWTEMRSVTPSPVP